MNSSALLFVCLIIGFAIGDKYEFAKNPGCNDPRCEKDVYLVELRSKVNGTQSYYVHYLIGSSEVFYPPSVVMAISITGKISVDWDTIFNASLPHAGAVRIDNVRSYGMMLFDLIEYNDLSDTANVDDSKQKNANLLKDYDFKSCAYYTHSDNPSVQCGSVRNDKQLGNVFFNVSVSDSSKIQKTPPGLKYVENLNFISVTTLKDLPISFEKGRYAAKYAYVTSYGIEKDFPMKEYRTVSDEYSPGVFKTTDLLLNEKSTNELLSEKAKYYRKAYVQWKQVSYAAFKSTIKSSRPIHVSAQEKLKHKQIDHYSSSLLYAFYGDRLAPKENSKDGAGVRLLTYSYGLAGDKFYKGSNYISWTSSMGIGNPPSYSYSSTALILIIVASLIPVLAICAFVGYKLLKRPFSSYRTMTNEVET